ncbi:MAG: tetratricopeptide repeat protein [Gammaproteobacteria bacterium]|nr:tetratricopeptide repeat protein [Gammaproteobacteria bacterium]
MGDQPATNWQYSAFISYTHADKRWARWLHKSLESYSVPGSVDTTKSPLHLKGRKLGRFFLDEAELGSSSDLSQSIIDALKASSALIVICSPAAAASAWVDEEIRTYRSIHGRGRIFCLIVDGYPAAAATNLDPALECFPSALLEGTEPLAADVRGGRSQKGEARDRLVAGLLQVGFDDLRQRELARRNQRLLVTSVASIGVAAVAIGLMVFAVNARNEAERQREAAEIASARSEQMLEFVLESFQSADPYKANGLEITAEEILHRSLARIEEELSGEEDVRRTMREAMALVYHRLGEYRTAASLLRKNLGEFDELADARELARHSGFLASSLIELGEYEEAESLIRRELQFHRDNPGLESGLGGTLNDLGRVLKDIGRLDEAAKYLSEAIEVLERTRPDALALMIAYNNMGVTLQRKGELAAAAPYFEKTLALREKRYGPEHPFTARAENNIGTLMYSLGRTEEAKHFYETALVKRKKVFGEEHAEVAESLYNVGLVYGELEQTNVALDYLNQALRMDIDQLGDTHPSVAYDYFAIARTYAHVGRWDEAGAPLAKAAKIRDARLSKTHQLWGSTKLIEAAHRLQQDKPSEAALIAEELLAHLDDMNRSDSVNWHIAAGIHAISTDRMRTAGAPSTIDPVALRKHVDAIRNADRRVEKSVVSIILAECAATDC